jgi:hypothetical protein
MAMLLVSAVAVTAQTQDNDNDCNGKWFCSNNFNSECQNFYGNSRYYTIEKWTFNDESNAYELEQENGLYNRFNIDVIGNREIANWNSNNNIKSVLAVGDASESFEGGFSGLINNTQNVNHITFCGYNNGNNGGSIVKTSNGPSNGVPEFPAFSIGAAVLVVTLGLVFLRKN